MGYWNAVAEYADGTRFEKNYVANETNYREECERQYTLEEHLVTRHDDCIYYSVTYVFDE